MNLLKGSFFLKLSAFVVALLTYNYIHNEIYSSEKNSADASYKLIKLTAKILPVKIRLETQPPDGYRLMEDGITVNPPQVAVIGPEALLEDTWNVQTSLVDVSESTKTVTKNVPLDSVSGISLVGDPYMVEVHVPIEKIADDTAAPSAPSPAESAST